MTHYPVSGVFEYAPVYDRPHREWRVALWTIAAAVLAFTILVVALLPSALRDLGKGLGQAIELGVTAPGSMLVTPDGRTIEFSNGLGTLNTLDITSGTVAPFGDPNAVSSDPTTAFGQAASSGVAHVGDLGWGPFGVYGVGNHRKVFLPSVDQSKPVVTSQNTIDGLAVSADGRTAYAVEGGSGLSTRGTLAVVSLVERRTVFTVALPDEPDSITVTPSGAMAYLLSSSASTIVPVNV